MRKILCSPAAAVLFLVAVGAPSTLVVASRGTEEQVPVRETTTFRIATPPQIERLLARRPTIRLGPDAVRQAGETVITEEGFDGDAFPPEGWQVTVGDTKLQDVLWSRETCEKDDAFPLNLASAWSVGGGSVGDELPCASPYTAPAYTILAYGPFDGRDFDGGLRAEWRSKHDVPADRGNDFPYGVCVQLASSGLCSVPSDAESPGWVSYRPDVWEGSANLEQAVVYVLYRDLTPTGEDVGAFVDNIRIIGLGEAAPTPGPGVTGTPGPAPTPPGASPVAHLPFTMNKVAKADVPGVEPMEPGAAVDFGTGWRNNRLVNPASVYQYGPMTLCARISWWGQQVGTRLHWEWFKDGAAVAKDDPDVNPTMSLDRAIGHEASCLLASLDGRPVPIPTGNFEVRVWLGSGLFPTTRGQVLIQADPPKGATPYPPSPTPFPTIAASPTPVVTPGTGPDCREFMVNGDFERGPSVGWTHGMDPTVPDHDIAAVIRNDVSTHNGDWAARMGGVLVTGGRFVEEIRQPSSPVGLIEPSRLLTATLRFFGGIVTEETPDNTPTDALLVAFVSINNPDKNVVIGGFSEESPLAAGRYQGFEADVTEHLSRRPPDWEDSLVVFQSQQDDKAATWHFLDDVSLNVCRRRMGGVTVAAPGSGGASAARMAMSGLALTAPQARVVAGGRYPPGSVSRLDVDLSSVPWLEPVGARELPATAATAGEVKWHAAPLDGE